MNMDKNEVVMINRLMEIVNLKLLETYDIKESNENVLILESSSEKKISFHLIFPKLVFPSHNCCKRFVMDILETMNPDDQELFKVFDYNCKKKCFIDTAVYSKNQNFRLLFSSKFGRKEELFVSKLSQYRFSCTDMIDCPDKFFFFLSLVGGKKLNVTIDKNKKRRVKENEKKIVCSSSICAQSLESVSKVINGIIEGGTIREVRKYENSKTQMPTVIYEIREAVINNILQASVCMHLRRD
jgi:hypothetical protein